MVDRGEITTSDARPSKLERPDAAPTESRSEVVSTDRSDAFSSDSSLNSGVDSQQNMEVHAKTQLQHKIGDSASNLMIPKLGTETFALVDEQNGIVHTGAGVLPRLPENITESYGENLQAIRPAKDESELQDGGHLSRNIAHVGCTSSGGERFSGVQRTGGKAVYVARRSSRND